MGDWQLYRYYGANPAASPPSRPKTVEAKQWDLTTTDALGRTISVSSTGASSGTRHHSTMDVTRGSISSSSTQFTKEDAPGLPNEPFTLRHGRRYIRNAQYYPLPCDLPELHRQNLQTLLATAVFGRALGSTPTQPPKKVLEVACGSGYWSAVCHDWLSGTYSC
jgi:hypothetical protein